MGVRNAPGPGHTSLGPSHTWHLPGAAGTQAEWPPNCPGTQRPWVSLLPLGLPARVPRLRAPHRGRGSVTRVSNAVPVHAVSRTQPRLEGVPPPIHRRRQGGVAAWAHEDPMGQRLPTAPCVLPKHSRSQTRSPAHKLPKAQPPVRSHRSHPERKGAREMTRATSKQ